MFGKLHYFRFLFCTAFVVQTLEFSSYNLGFTEKKHDFKLKQKEMVAVDNRKNVFLSQNGTLSSTQYCSLTTEFGCLTF